jgi:hypothetical protein
MYGWDDGPRHVFAALLESCLPPLHACLEEDAAAAALPDAMRTEPVATRLADQGEGSSSVRRIGGAKRAKR